MEWIGGHGSGMAEWNGLRPERGVGLDEMMRVPGTQSAWSQSTGTVGSALAAGRRCPDRGAGHRVGCTTNMPGRSAPAEVCGMATSPGHWRSDTGLEHLEEWWTPTSQAKEGNGNIGNHGSGLIR